MREMNLLNCLNFSLLLFISDVCTLSCYDLEKLRNMINISLLLFKVSLNIEQNMRLKNYSGINVVSGHAGIFAWKAVKHDLPYGRPHLGRLID